MPTDLHDHAGTDTIVAADQKYEVLTSDLSLSIAIYVRFSCEGGQFLAGLAHHVHNDQWMIEIAGVDGVAVARSRAEIAPIASRIYESGEITPEPRS